MGAARYPAFMLAFHGACAAVALGCQDKPAADVAKSGRDPAWAFEVAADFSAIASPDAALCAHGTAEVDFAVAGQTRGFVFSAAAGQKAELRTVGDPAFDSVLALFGPRSTSGYYGAQPLAVDDDSGPGLLAAISNFEFTATGDYMAVVTTVGGNSKGSVTVTLAIDGGPGCPPAAPECVADEDCSDDDPCTLDTCASGSCQASPDPACVPQCLAHLDCDDGEPCTLDACDDGDCTYAPNPDCAPDCTVDADCDDADPCTIDACDAGTCAHVPDPSCAAASCPRGQRICAIHALDGDIGFDLGVPYATCALRLAASTGGGIPHVDATAIEFELVYSPKTLSLLGFTDEVCFGKDTCFHLPVTPLSPPLPGPVVELSTGHTATVTPTTTAAWNTEGAGALVLANVTAPDTPLTGATWDGTALAGEPTFVTAVFGSPAGLPASGALVCIDAYVAADVESIQLTTVVTDAGLLLTSPQCTQDKCDDADPCTEDSCDQDHCVHLPIPSCAAPTCPIGAALCALTSGAPDLGLDLGVKLAACPLAIAADATQGPPILAAALQLTLSYDASAVELVGIVDELCPAPDACFLGPIGALESPYFPAPTNYSFSTGHSAAYNPGSTAEWDSQGGGAILISNIADADALLSPATAGSDGIVGDPTIAWLLFAVPDGLPSQGTPICAHDLVGAAPDATQLDAFVGPDGVIVTSP